MTLEEAAKEWQRLAEAHVIRNKKGEEFKPAALRAYERAIRLRVLPEYGHEALADLKRPVWATAMYAGLRRGELGALRVSDVDPGHRGHPRRAQRG